MTHVRWSVVDAVGMVTLDHPARRNALDRDVAAELAAAVDAVEQDPDARAIVVTGAGSAFCAGADLGLLGQAGEAELRAVYRAFLRIAEAELPTIAAVNGPAVGAGMNLALACDLRLAARSAKFDSRFLRLGVHPGGGHSWLLSRTAGPAVASAMVLFGETMDGEQAARAGLAHRCLPDPELVDHASTLAARLATVPRELVTRTKATLAGMAGVTSHAEAVEQELVHQLWSIGQPGFSLPGRPTDG